MGRESKSCMSVWEEVECGKFNVKRILYCHIVNLDNMYRPTKSKWEIVGNSIALISYSYSLGRTIEAV